MARGMRFWGWLAGGLLVCSGLAALFVLNPTAREVTVDALGLAFAFFTTPFILETTCAALFLLGLLAYNHWRMHREGDGWVWLMTQEPKSKDLPAKITQRLQSTVLEQKPEPVDESQAESGIIEGYLELGMPSQALAELDANIGGLHALEAACLRIRVLAANLDTDEALALQHETAGSDPAARILLANVSLENARWLLRHVHREDLARRWLAEARALHPASVAAVKADDALRKIL